MARTGQHQEITIKLATILARHCQNNKTIVCKSDNISDIFSVIDALDKKFPGIKSVLCTKQHKIADSINIYVNGENVRYLQGLNTILTQGDLVNIIPAAAAG